MGGCAVSCQLRAIGGLCQRFFGMLARDGGLWGDRFWVCRIEFAGFVLGMVVVCVVWGK